VVIIIENNENLGSGWPFWLMQHLRKTRQRRKSIGVIKMASISPHRDRHSARACWRCARLMRAARSRYRAAPRAIIAGARCAACRYRTLLA